MDMIRKMANWSAEDNWNVPGIFFADELALVYDVGTFPAAFQTLLMQKVIWNASGF